MTAQVQLQEWQQPVLTMPLNQAFPELGQVREFKSRQCIFNHDRSRLFNVVSPKYQVIEHTRAIDTISEALAALGENPEVSVRSLANGARIHAEFKLKLTPPVEVKVGDVVEARLYVRNAHDGLWRFSCGIAGFRLACLNGLKVPVTLAGLSGKHFPSLGGEKQFTERMGDLLKKVPLVGKIWSAWASQSLTLDDAREILKPEKELLPKKMLDRVLDETHFQPTRSKWDLYNDLTYITTHEAKSINRRIDLDEVIEKLFYNPREPLPIAEAA